MGMTSHGGQLRNRSDAVESDATTSSWSRQSGFSGALLDAGRSRATGDGAYACAAATQVSRKRAGSVKLFANMLPFDGYGHCVTSVDCILIH
jgi:hypothetical protein